MSDPNHSPHAPASQDYWVNGTILSLYEGFCKSFLRRFPHQSDEETLLLGSFMDRLGEIYLGQGPNIDYTALNRERWKFLCEAGQKLLEHRFPVVSQKTHVSRNAPRARA